MGFGTFVATVWHFTRIVLVPQAFCIRLPVILMARSNTHGRPGQSPESGQQAKAHDPDIGRPPGILSQDGLLGMDAIQERRPSDRGQQNGAAVPLCTVEANVRQDIGKVERMAYQAIRTRSRATSLHPPQRAQPVDVSRQDQDVGLGNRALGRWRRRQALLPGVPQP